MGQRDASIVPTGDIKRSDSTNVRLGWTFGETPTSAKCQQETVRRRAGAHGREAAGQRRQPKRDRVDQKAKPRYLDDVYARIYFEVISKVGSA